MSEDKAIHRRLWALMPAAILAGGLIVLGALQMQRIALLDEAIAILDRNEARHAE